MIVFFKPKFGGASGGDSITTDDSFALLSITANPVERLWNVASNYYSLAKPTTRSDSTNVLDVCKLLPTTRLRAGCGLAFCNY